jgi:hypothetical protein
MNPYARSRRKFQNRELAININLGKNAPFIIKILKLKINGYE